MKLKYFDDEVSKSLSILAPRVKNRTGSGVLFLKKWKI